MEVTHSVPPVPETVAPSRRRSTPWWLWVLTLALLVVNVALQRPETLSVGEIEELKNGTSVEPPTPGPEIALGKLSISLKGKTLLGAPVGDTVLMQFEQYVAETEFAQDKFRYAALVGKLGYSLPMHDLLNKLDGSIVPTSPLHEDIQTVRTLMPANGPGGEPPQAALDNLVKRHGWFGRVLLDDGSAGGVIEKARQDGAELTTIGIRYLSLQAAICMTGVIVLIMLGVLAATGRLTAFPTRWRTDDETTAGTPVNRLWLETVAAFLGGFLLIKLAAALIAVVGGMTPGVVWVSLLAPWLLMPLILWPVFRGLDWERFRHGIGWHRGRGVLREIGTGMVCYAALIPILFIVTLIVMLVSSALGFKPPQVANRAFELGSARGLELLVTFALVTIWAPLVEEAVFRGALYRFARSHARMFVAVIVSASAFAMMHGYGPLQLVAVGTLGFGFACLREWRGSLLACMTGHFIQNALAFSFITQISPLIGG